jgi:hypothetical protein
MATTIKSLTVPVRDKAEHDCHCGCGSSDGTCCSLDCIVKPRFFCGQLLTDADLSAMLKWSRDRFGLSRYRHGWGVVCGLDVRCDPQGPTSVIVTPGYAVNCCGDDIIVCETAALDLKGACRPDEDPCADLRRERDSLRGGNRIGANLDAALGRKSIDLGAGQRMGGEIFEEDMRVVDIYLSYTEQPTDPSTALGRSSCKQTPECEYSRTRESYKLSWELGVTGSDPIGMRARTWHEGYDRCLEVLTTFRKKFNQSSVAGDVRRWLLRWIDEHPQYQLCGQRDGLCQADDEFFSTEKNLVQALFALVQNCRNAYLQCECFACDEDTRVPLARVWLTPDDSTTGQQCRILTIDPYPPYRRPIQPECWPAPLGYVNVGRFIWHRWEEVCPKSADLGLRIKKAEFKLPATLAELESSLKCDLFIKCDDVRTALIHENGLLGSRVIGFCETVAPPPVDTGPKKTGAIDVTIDHSMTDTAIGLQATFNYTVRNTGDGDLINVSAGWSLTAVGGGTTEGTEGIGALAAGQSHVWSERAPLGFAAGVDTQVVATGTDKATGQHLSKTKTDSVRRERPSAQKLDEFGDLGSTDEQKFQIEKGRLDNYAKILLATPSMRGAILVFASTAEQAAVIKIWQDHLVNARGIDASRLTFQSVKSQDFKTELWLVPEGADIPQPPTRVISTPATEDLTVLKGIGGPRMKILNKEGIMNFAHLAVADPNRLKQLFPTERDHVQEWIEEAKKRTG